MDGKTDCTGHALYEKVKKYIDSHPLDYQERATKQSLYCIALANDFLEYAGKQYYERQKEKQREVFDIVYLRDLFRKISAMLGGEEEMERVRNRHKESLSSLQTNDVKKQKKRLAACQKRATDLEILIRKIYEDNALGKLSDKRYESLSAEYENEQAALENEIAGLHEGGPRYACRG